MLSCKFIAGSVPKHIVNANNQIPSLNNPHLQIIFQFDNQNLAVAFLTTLNACLLWPDSLASAKAAKLLVVLFLSLLLSNIILLPTLFSLHHEPLQNAIIGGCYLRSSWCSSLVTVQS